MKTHIILGTLLLFLSFTVPVMSNASSQVFFQPHTGFLRVTTQILIEPDSPDISFTLFPNAQITLIWVNNLASYVIDRTEDYTQIHLELTGNPSQEEMLELSYEGFLTESMLENNKLTKEDHWFPVFSIPNYLAALEVTLPSEYQLETFDPASIRTIRPGVYRWEAPLQIYPVLVFGEDLAEIKSPSAPQTLDQEQEFFDEPERLDPGFDLVSPDTLEDEKFSVEEEVLPPVDSPLLEANDTTVKPSDTNGRSPLEIAPRFNIELRLDNLDDLRSLRERFSPTPDTTSPEQRLKQVISRWDQALADREQSVLEELIHADLANRSGLINYLTNLPQGYQEIRSEIVEMEKDNNGFKVEVQLLTNEVPRYLYQAYWLRQAEEYRLREFSMQPQPIDNNSELFNYVGEWLEDLRAKVADGDSLAIKEILALKSQPEPSVLRFFENIAVTSEWDFYSLDPTSLVASIILSQNGASYLLDLSLSPARQGWNITEVRIRPL